MHKSGKSTRVVDAAIQEFFNSNVANPEAQRIAIVREPSTDQLEKTVEIMTARLLEEHGVKVSVQLKEEYAVIEGEKMFGEEGLTQEEIAEGNDPTKVAVEGEDGELVVASKEEVDSMKAETITDDMGSVEGNLDVQDQEG